MTDSFTFLLFKAYIYERSAGYERLLEDDDKMLQLMRDIEDNRDTKADFETQRENIAMHVHRAALNNVHCNVL